MTSPTTPRGGLPPEIQRDRDVERLAKKAKLPPYMWDTLEGLAALGRFMDAARATVVRSETAAPDVDYVKLGAGIVLDPVPADKKGDVDVPMIEAACAELLEMSGIDLGGDEMRRVLQAAIATAPRSAIGARDWEAKYKNDLHNFMALERWLNSHYPSVMEEWEDTPTDSRTPTDG